MIDTMIDAEQALLFTYVSEIRESSEKDKLISIIDYKIDEIRDSLEDTQCNEVLTAVHRGSILSLRELSDLFT